MVTHPIHIRRDFYRGSNARRRERALAYNRAATELEAYINQLLKTQLRPIQQYTYSEIAAATGYDLETVRELCYGIDGGHNGFTAFKSGMTMTQAMDAAAKP